MAEEPLTAAEAKYLALRKAGKSQTEAAKASGFSRAKSRAGISKKERELRERKFTQVDGLEKKADEAIEKHAILSVTECLELVSSIAADPETGKTDRLRASELLIKAQGGIEQRINLTGAVVFASEEDIPD